MTAVWTESVARPGRRPYRARSAPSVEVFGGYGLTAREDVGLVVTRTHDVDVATALAARYWAGEFGGPLPAPTACWMRLVPWSDQGYDATWLDAEPGDRGAMPCVEFRLPDPGW